MHSPPSKNDKDPFDVKCHIRAQDGMVEKVWTLRVRTPHTHHNVWTFGHLDNESVIVSKSKIQFQQNSNQSKKEKKLISFWLMKFLENLRVLCTISCSLKSSPMRIKSHFPYKALFIFISCHLLFTGESILAN